MSGSRYWIVGAGGIGCAFGARLARDRAVTFFDGWAAHVDAMAARGLSVEYPHESLDSDVRARHLGDVSRLYEEEGAPDVVLLAVKSGDTQEVVTSLAPHIGAAPIISLQNGLNEEAIAAVVGRDRTIGAVVRFNGRLIGPGRAAQSRAGPLVIGELDGGMSPRVEALAQDLRPAGQIELSSDIRSVLWSKLVLNCMINAVAAVADADLGEVARSHQLSGACVAVALEAIATATAVGIQLDESTLYGVPQERIAAGQPGAIGEFATRFRSAYAESEDLQPSMLQDLRKGRRTEVRALNGFIVETAEATSVPTPLNALALDLVEAAERGDATPGRQLVADLLAAVDQTGSSSRREAS